LLHARLTGVVLWNGIPVANTAIQPRGTRTDGRGEVQMVEPPVGQLDASGAFALDLPAATYRLHVALPERPAWSKVPADETVAVTAGQEVHQVFNVRTSVLHLSALREDGSAAVGVPIWVASLDGAWSAQASATGSDGRAVLDPVPARTLELSIWPEPMTRPGALQEFLRSHPGDLQAWQRAKLPLGQVEVAAGGGAPAEITVTIPSSAGY
jgi:hypothetical protein